MGFDNVVSNSDSNTWKQSLNCSIVVNSAQCITLKCGHDLIEESYYLSATYANCTRRERQSLWDHLSNLNLQDEVWLLGGGGWNLNIIRKSEKRLGGNPIDFNASNYFNDFIDSCGFLEFSKMGSSYNWQKSGQQMW